MIVDYTLYKAACYTFQATDTTFDEISRFNCFVVNIVLFNAGFIN